MFTRQRLASLLFVTSYFQYLKMVVSQQQLIGTTEASEKTFSSRTTSVTTELSNTDISGDRKSQEMSPFVALPQHRIGCPSLNGFAVQNWTVPEGQLTRGTSQITLGYSYLTWCMFRYRHLPRGKYCFVKVDTCPDNFQKVGLARIKSAANPDSPYIIKYCCRDDGDKDVAVNFPTWEGSFYLMPFESKCQQISGYDVTKEYWQWWLNYLDISASYVEVNSSPDKTVVQMRVCYYAIKNYWPTGFYRLLEPPEGCTSDFQSMKINPLFEGLGKSFWLDLGNGNADTLTDNLAFCKRRNGQLEMHQHQGFPTGQYCVLGNGQGCPELLSMERVSVRNETGVVFVFVYCCMVNGYPGSTINLPSKEPFYLLPYNFTCPNVNGMVTIRQSITFKKKSDRLRVQVPSFLSVQLHISSTQVKFGVCKYQPKPTQGGSGQENDLGLIRAITGLLCGVLGVVVAVVGCCCRRHLCPKIRSQLRHKPIQEESQSGSSMQMTSSCRTSLEIGSLLKMVLDPESQMTIYSHLIHPNKIETMENVGKGAFGTVYRGRYRPDANPLHAQDVAIKTLKEHCAYPEISAFMEEAIVMADFRHANVLTMIGVCVHPTTHIPTLVLPFMEHGDLQKYLRKFRYEDDFKDKVPEPLQLLSFCLHIARGMTYLSGMKFVHRDLAARNCMLDGNMVVKVADFGLARDIYANSYYRQDKTKLLPIKWMALESLHDRVFSIYTDVWSYGVTMWEIFTLGKVPYPELENIQVLPELQKGSRLPKPESCPDALYDLLLNCWQENPKSRPSFSDMCIVIEQALDGMSDYLDLDTNKGSPRTADLSVGVVCSPTDLTGVEIKEIHPQTSYADYRETWSKNQTAT